MDVFWVCIILFAILLLFIALPYLRLLKMVGGVSQYSLGQVRQFCERFLSVGNKMIHDHFKVWISQSEYLSRVLGFLSKMMHEYCKILVSKSDSLSGFVAGASLLSFLLAMACGYFFVFPRFQPGIPIYGVPMVPESQHSDPVGKCNGFDGKWIRDESYPLYNASLCPFAEQGFNCLANGRKDQGYLKWRWKPNHCEIPRFRVQEVLEKLRGKRIVFVGDSLARTQWESMICLLMAGVEDGRTVYEIFGNKITKRIRFLCVIFDSYNLRIDFYRSVFLVQSGPVPRRAPKRVKSVLRLDQIDDISKEWVDSDVLVFNSGHWWTPSKLFDMGCYFQVGRFLKLGMRIHTAFKTALNTWSSWAETNINAKRTKVFFRTFESSHWSGKSRNSCKVTRQPSSRTNGRDQNRFSDIIMDAVKNITVPVTVLHVTPMGAFRSDAHVGTWGDSPSVPDCSHWCLPGLPDTWNEILLWHLLSGDGLSHG